MRDPYSYVRVARAATYSIMGTCRENDPGTRRRAYQRVG
jgi:hypothetical protein